MLVRVGADVGERLGPLLRQHAGRQVHAVARQGQDQAQDFAAVALVLPRGRDRRVASHAALPDGVGDLGLAMRRLGDGEVGEEEEVEQGVDELFGKRFRLLELLDGRLGLYILYPVEENLVGNRRLPSRLVPWRPEQLVFPRLQRLLFVDEGKDPGEHADAVQGFSVGSEFRIGEGGVVSQHEQAVRHGADQAFEVLERIVAGAAHVGRGEEAEDVFGGFGQLPELVGWQLADAPQGRAGQGSS